jgi:hypothetical protein
MEAMIGQFYIAVLVARLVSMYRSEQPQQADQLEEESDELISPSIRRLISRARD